MLFVYRALYLYTGLALSMVAVYTVFTLMYEMVVVRDTSVGGNHRFSDLQTTANDDGRKDLIFYRKCSLKSLLSSTTLVGPSVKHGVLRGEDLKQQRKVYLKRTENLQKSCISSRLDLRFGSLRFLPSFKPNI